MNLKLHNLTYTTRSHGDLWRKLVPDRANHNDPIDANRHEPLGQCLGDHVKRRGHGDRDRDSDLQ